MPGEHERKDSEEGGLQVHDRFPVRLTPLDADQAAAVAAGELHARTSGPHRPFTGHEATVDALVRAFPPDERPEGPLFEALRLVDAKLSHMIALLEAQYEENEEGDDRDLPVEISLTHLRVGLPATDTPHPGPGDWVWAVCQLPQTPRIRFEAPGQVIQAGNGERAAYWVTVRLANVTEAEEKVLSEYIFRRHRQEVRQQRHPSGTDQPDSRS